MLPQYGVKVNFSISRIYITTYWLSKKKVKNDGIPGPCITEVSKLNYVADIEYYKYWY